MVYEVLLTHQDGIWLIEATELRGVRSYGRSVKEAAANVREAIAAAEDLESWDHLDLLFSLANSDLDDVVHALVSIREAESEIRGLRHSLLLRLIGRLHDSGMSFRDIAEIVGLSHQRVAQLANQKPGTGRVGNLSDQELMNSLRRYGVLDRLGLPG